MPPRIITAQADMRLIPARGTGLAAMSKKPSNCWWWTTRINRDILDDLLCGVGTP